jgi:hypothetical protein
MKPLETWAYALLLLVAAGLSWSSWTKEEVEEKSSSVVFDPAGGLSAIKWTAEKNVATLAVEGKGDDLAVWVEAGRKERIDATSDDDDSAGGDASTEATYGEPELKAFPGNDQAVKLVDSFTPLTALREFGNVDDATLAEMGLDQPEATLELDAGGRTLKLHVGDKAYGSSDTYARNAATGAVYLISSKVIGPLRGAESRLMERNPLAFEAIEVAAATLSTPAGAEATASHEGRHDPDNAFWADPAQPEAVDTARDALMDKVFQLRATSYSDIDEQVADGDVVRVAGIAFTAEDGAPLGSLELARQPDAERSKPDEPAWLWWARSERTRGQWVAVSRTSGQELSDQIEALLAE